MTLWQKAMDIAVGVTGVSVVLPAALKSVAAIALTKVGFTSLGPAAGSFAAQWMSSIALANGGGVAAGSLYATLQAAAMTLPIFNPVAAVVGTSAAGYFALRRYLWSGRSSQAS
jgi:hypothetical protein